ncbi:MAG: SOS response-associated peptidase [Deltaproteobacteria bacterium]|nr:SOS response-associated peptidase [Deltaproteobacteria bacterium]
MCGRYTQTASPENLMFRFGLTDQGFTVQPRYNLAPGQDAPTVISEGPRVLRMMHWGLVPSWAKDASIGNRMINARAETLTEKRTFKALLDRKRCLVLADGFYEWQKRERGKLPIRFVLKDRGPFAFAGLWDSWRKPDGSELQSFTIITTGANDLLRPVHERMPVILDRKCEEEWLDLDLKNTAKLIPLLKAYPSRDMEAYCVSKMVNSPTNDRPECIQAVDNFSLE